MPISSFRLKSTIGRNYPADHDDTLRVKKALNQLGYYKIPAFYGLTGYADEAMFRGIEKLQDDFGLERDAIIKPGGETERSIQASYNDAIASREHKSGPNEHTQVAGIGAVIGPVARTAAALLLAPLADKAGKKLGRWYDGDNGFEPANENERTSIANPVPPIPPQSPPPKIDNKTEFPASGPEVPHVLINPIPSPRDPNIFIYPQPDADLATTGNILESRGNAATKEQIDRIRDWFYETHDPNDWQQYGGRDRLTGKEITEYYIPGPAGDFNRADGSAADGRKGSRRTDLTFINQKTGQRIHIQTTDYDKNGQVAPRERDAEHDIRRFEFLRGRNLEAPYTTQIFIIPKNAPTDKLKPIQ